MKKYIDADKIRNAIESEADNWQDTYTDYMRDNLLTIIDSLQQEQPFLPSNLNDAANRFAVSYDQGTCDGIAQECFKAGAEWAMQQLKGE